jgi:hypothetical protein
MTVNYCGICFITLTPGQNLVRVFNSRSRCENAMHLQCYEAEQLNLKLKTCHKLLLGSHPSALVLPAPTLDLVMME